MEEVPLNGKLDKLEFDGNSVNVVDYKTGNFEYAKKKFNRPDEDKVAIAKQQQKEVGFENEFGGDYWRQAVFYKVLMDYDQTKSWDMRTAEFDFVEPDKKTGEFLKQKVAITPADMEIVKGQIVRSYRSIKAKQFSNGCHKEDCVWCTFVSDYYAGKAELAAPKGVTEGEEELN
jgi:DNA helicase-2/ATP-dependent DNA helicase PcrA